MGSVLRVSEAIEKKAALDGREITVEGYLFVTSDESFIATSKQKSRASDSILLEMDGLMDLLSKKGLSPNLGTIYVYTGNAEIRGTIGRESSDNYGAKLSSPKALRVSRRDQTYDVEF